MSVMPRGWHLIRPTWMRGWVTTRSSVHEQHNHQHLLHRRLRQHPCTSCKAESLCDLPSVTVRMGEAPRGTYPQEGNQPEEVHSTHGPHCPHRGGFRLACRAWGDCQAADTGPG